MLADLIKYCGTFFESTFLTWNAFKFGCTTVIGILFAFLGASTEAFILLTGLIIVDLLMALLVVARTEMRLESRKLWHTAEKAFIIFLLLASTQASEKILYIPFAAEMLATVMVASQLISILEHVAQLGIVIPLPLLKTLRKIQNGQTH